jgi:phospholipase/lecithinase/hemolysin
MRRSAWLTVVAIAFLTGASLDLLRAAQDFRGVITFGDSLSDMGNRWLDPKKPDIKFRQTWVVQLASPAMLNVPGLKPSGIATYFGGDNYAVGGASTDATSAMGSARNRGQDLTQQVSKRYLNPAFNTNGVKPNALHVIVIGANDIMQASIDLEQVLSQWSDFDKTGVAVARSTERQIGVLAAAGVRRVLWGTVFDVAQGPALVKRSAAFPSLAPAYLAAVTKAARAHNTEMDAAIVRLEKAHPTLRITKLDLFARFAEVAAHPAQFGFTDVTTGANDSKHLFSADGLHPTPSGHKMLAEYAFSVLSKK